MEMKTNFPKNLRQRKLLIALPVLALPFVTLLFWALGGGKTDNAPGEPTARNGFNLRLPDASLTDDASLDKLSYYDKAQADSAKFEQLLKNDPYYRWIDTGRTAAGNLPVKVPVRQPSGGRSSGAFHQTGGSSHGAYRNPNEAKIYRKIEQLNAILDRADAEPAISEKNVPEASSQDTPAGADIDRLQQMMQALDQPEGADTEMRQIDGMLEKILDIQHPERAEERIREASRKNRAQVLPVVSATEVNLVSLLGGEPFLQSKTHPVHSRPPAREPDGFYSLGGGVAENNPPNAIEAVIHQTQTLTDGSTVKLRLATGVYTGGMLIPKDHFLYGTASLEGERLRIQIKGIRYGNSLFPVQLSVYDTDGLSGIHVPGTVAREAAKQSAGGLAQGVNLGTLDASFGAQAAGAGIEAARNLLGKRARQVRVTVKAGHQVLLRDEKQKDNP